MFNKLIILSFMLSNFVLAQDPIAEQLMYSSDLLMSNYAIQKDTSIVTDDSSSIFPQPTGLPWLDKIGKNSRFKDSVNIRIPAEKREEVLSYFVRQIEANFVYPSEINKIENNPDEGIDVVLTYLPDLRKNTPPLGKEYLLIPIFGPAFYSASYSDNFEGSRPFALCAAVSDVIDVGVYVWHLVEAARTDNLQQSYYDRIGEYQRASTIRETESSRKELQESYDDLITNRNNIRTSRVLSWVFLGTSVALRVIEYCLPDEVSSNAAKNYFKESTPSTLSLIPGMNPLQDGVAITLSIKF